MHIQLESALKHSIQAYDDQQVVIDGQSYQHSLLVSGQQLIADLAVKHIHDLSLEHLTTRISSPPEVIIIGHNETGKLPSIDLISRLSKQGIGVEFMSLGAACRTFNVLLAEGR